MTRYLAIYMASDAAVERAGWGMLTKKAINDREQEGFRLWMDWSMVNVDRIVDQGTPLGRTKRASPDGIEDIRNAMTGYVIVEAETHEEAAAMFANHPHFTIFPGDSVEIVECLPLPER